MTILLGALSLRGVGTGCFTWLLRPTNFVFFRIREVAGWLAEPQSCKDERLGKHLGPEAALGAARFSQVE